MLRIALLPGAEIDMLESYDWYAERSARAATRFESAIEASYQQILKSPMTWPMADARHHFFKVRKYPFSVICRIEPDELLDVAIAHSSREEGYSQTRVP